MQPSRRKKFPRLNTSTEADDNKRDKGILKDLRRLSGGHHYLKKNILLPTLFSARLISKKYFRMN
jgi:hypothetical protein